MSNTKELNQIIKSLLNDNNIKVQITFIPFSKSRNKKKNYKSFNYKILLIGESDSMVFDYSMGVAHSPSYNQFKRNDPVLNKETECGTIVNQRSLIPTLIKIIPDITDIIYSLLVDSEVSNYSTFEEWAGAMGYNPDSRIEENIYNQCIKKSKDLLNIINPELINQLSELLENY